VNQYIGLDVSLKETAISVRQDSKRIWRGKCPSDPKLCQRNRLEPSMSRRGNCWDNAVAESFFASLKKERIRKRIYTNRASATEDVRDYIDSFYNPIRRRRHLGGVSPEVFEANAKRA